MLSAAVVMPCLAAPADSNEEDPYVRCTTLATSGKASAVEVFGACLGPASEGAPGAMYVMESLSLRSNSLEQKSSAVPWLEKAATAGHPAAAFELAQVYFARPSEADRVEGVRWLSFAACSGCPRQRPSRKIKESSRA